MREILFRGQDAVTREWIYGCYVDNRDRGRCPPIIVPKNGNPHIYVIPETVGQFTGLVDRNGKRIFEGDILCAMTGWSWNGKTRERYLEYVKVIYNSQKARFEIFGKLGGSHKALDQAVNKYDALLCGNIHDNPELLKEQK